MRCIFLPFPRVSGRVIEEFPELLGAIHVELRHKNDYFIFQKHMMTMLPKNVMTMRREITVSEMSEITAGGMSWLILEFFTST